MRIGWENYYKDLDIPKTWENISYVNDELPSFMYNKFQIWIDQKDLDKLIYETRFCVLQLDDDYQTINDSWYLITDDFDEVLKTVNQKKFEFNGCEIFDPTKSECGRFEVDPKEYYGQAYLNTLINKE